MPPKKQKKILINEDDYLFFKDLVKKAHNGKIKGFMAEEVGNALRYYAERGYLSEFLEGELGELTTTVDGSEKLTNHDFLQQFDNYLIPGNQHIYNYDRIDSDTLRTIITGITGNDGNWTYRKYSKLLRYPSDENNHKPRLNYRKGTTYWFTERSNFEFISSELKKALDERLELRTLQSHDNLTKENIVDRVYRKLEKGKVIETDKIMELMNCSRQKANKIVKEMLEIGMLYEFERGFFKVMKREEWKETKALNELDLG